MPRPKGYKLSDEQKRAMAEGRKNYHEKSREEKNKSKAEMEAQKAKRIAELTTERKAQLGAEIMAHEQAMMEMSSGWPEVAKARAKWQIDKAKLTTHAQYITAIATMPIIDPSDPQQVRDRMADYLDIVQAAGQRIVFETCALALGLSRFQLRERINGNTRMSIECQKVYTQIHSILDAALAEYAHSGESNALSTIFFAKNNQLYTNDDPKVIAENSDMSAEQTDEEIAAKYGDLPV